MRLHRFFLVLVLVSIMQLTAHAYMPLIGDDKDLWPLSRPDSGVTETPKTPRVAPDAALDEMPEPERVTMPERVRPSLPLPLPTPLAELSRGTVRDSYLSAFEILREENACSRFFGGSATALEVLNRLVEQLQSRRLDNRLVSIRMSGTYTQVSNELTGARYRLFEQATLNSNGPLIGMNAADTTRMLFGSFRANTRRARALMFLHELGHLVQREGRGGWLIPNDGDDLKLSEQNTKTVERQCTEQLASIKE